MFSKFYLIFVVFVFTLIFTNNADAWMMRAVYHNDAHPGKCYVNERLILSPGQRAKSPEGCSEIHCSNANGESQIIGCGKMMPPKNCRWDGYENVDADFPLCCVEKFICDNPADIPEAQMLQNHARDMFRRQWENRKN